MSVLPLKADIHQREWHVGETCLAVLLLILLSLGAGLVAGVGSARVLHGTDLTLPPR